MNRHQYTVRNVPLSVDRALRRRATERGISLNTMLLEALEKEAGLGSEPKMHDDLDKLVGSWVQDPEVDLALAEQRTVDSRDWQ